ncbi:MAG: sugar-binding protein [Chitinispirillales bacterium]|jgi:putative multiple sugar transport system substrate-binding protein|nr:sugar-binding protein [Chitinispirillales bacterium]
MKRSIAVLSTAAIAAALLAGFGCNKSGSSSSSGALIGIAIPETHVTRWIKDGATLKSEAEKRGYRTEVQFADGDQSIQNRQIQSFLTLESKLLVVGNIDESIVPVIAEAAQKKVAVIAYDRLILGSADYDYYITFNNSKVGVLQGQSLAEALSLDEATAKAPKLIALFAGSMTDANAFAFYDGAMSVLNPYIEKGALKVIGPYAETSADRDNFSKLATAGWDGDIAKERMAALLKAEAKNVTLDAVLAPNDHIARKIIEVCKANAKYSAKLPLVCGQDAEFESSLFIKSGDQLSTIFKNTSKLAEAAIILADQILKGQTPDIPGAILASGPLEKLGDTGKKVVKTYLLDPILVTKDNLNVPVEAEFYTAAESEALK